MADELWWRDGRIEADQLTEFVLAVDVPDLDGGALTFRVRPHMTDPDLNGDGVVDIVDFLALLASWGPCPDLPFECPADLDGNLNVGIVDMLELLSNWG